MWFDEDGGPFGNSEWDERCCVRRPSPSSRDIDWDVQDDWAVNPPAPKTAKSASELDAAERLGQCMSAWESALGMFDKSAPALELRLLVCPDVPATFVDVNSGERESWLRWARRTHPEWGDPKPPRRLAPRMERTATARKGWAVIVLVLDNSTGYPEIVARRNVSGDAPDSLDFWWPDKTDIGPRTKIVRRAGVGTVSLRGEWVWNRREGRMWQEFPGATAARRAWVETHADVIREVMAKANDLARDAVGSLG